MNGLWTHQLEGLEYLEHRTNGLLMHGVGTGKTRTTLEFIKHKKFKLVLVVANQKGASVWQKQNIEHGFNFSIYTLNIGTVKERTKEMRVQLSNTQFFPLIFVLNYEASIRAPLKELLLKLKFDAIIYDEVHKLRGFNTKQSRLAWALAKASPQAYRLGLTGTIIYNRPLDVFGIFRFIDPEVFGTKWTDFRYRYAVWGGQFGQIPLYFINKNELIDKVKANSHIIDRHEVLDLPDEQHIQRFVQFESSARKQYDELNKEFITWLEDGRDLTAKNILEKVGKLQQFTGGFVYRKGETVHVSKAKAQLLEELLEEIGDEDVVIFYKFNEEANIIKNVADSLAIPIFFINGSNNDYEAWLSSVDKSIICVQSQSGSESLDYTKSSITIFFSLTYSYGQYEQMLGRISRGNQLAKTVSYYYLLVEDSIDEKIWKILQEKKDLASELLSGSG